MASDSFRALFLMVTGNDSRYCVTYDSGYECHGRAADAWNVGCVLFFPCTIGVAFPATMEVSSGESRR